MVRELTTKQRFSGVRALRCEAWKKAKDRSLRQLLQEGRIDANL